MEKRIKEKFAGVSLLQFQIVEMNVVSTSVETHPTFIEIGCVCKDTDQCAAVLALIVKSGLFEPDSIRNIEFDDESKTYSINVKID